MIEVTFYFTKPDADGDTRVTFEFNSIYDYIEQISSDSFPLKTFTRMDDTDDIVDIQTVNFTDFFTTSWKYV